jgi:hypothetical protein
MRWRAVLVALALVTAACTGPGAATSQSLESTTSVAPTTALPEELAASTVGWQIDWSNHSVSLAEIHVGIPGPDPRDRIPPIDHPSFETVTSASDWLADDEPGVVIAIGTDSRFYPLRVLTRHEIVNDEVSTHPVVVTYCPLCNTGLAFDPVVRGQHLRFGVSGLLRNSDLVMWDNQTNSLWQQVTGEAIVGHYTGEQLAAFPTRVLRWADFAGAYPDGRVLGRDQGFGIVYGSNPYAGYSSLDAPFQAFYDKPVDPRYPAMSRVVGVDLEGAVVAFPFDELAGPRVANDVIDGRPVVVFWGAPETVDALDTAQIPDGRAVGTGVAYFATVGDQDLTFSASSDDLFVDDQTGTAWTLLGAAVDGPLEGRRLQVAPHANEFWFAWEAFHPDSPVWTAP